MDSALTGSSAQVSDPSRDANAVSLLTGSLVRAEKSDSDGSLHKLRLWVWLSWQQVENLCGEGGRLGQMRSDLIQLNATNRHLENKLANLSRTAGMDPHANISSH